MFKYSPNHVRDFICFRRMYTSHKSWHTIKAKPACARSAQPSLYNIHQNASVDCIHRWNIYSCTADRGFSGGKLKAITHKKQRKVKACPMFPRSRVPPKPDWVYVFTVSLSDIPQRSFTGQNHIRSLHGLFHTRCSNGHVHRNLDPIEISFYFRSNWAWFIGNAHFSSQIFDEWKSQHNSWKEADYKSQISCKVHDNSYWNMSVYA